MCIIIKCFTRNTWLGWRWVSVSDFRGIFYSSSLWNRVSLLSRQGMWKHMLQITLRHFPSNYSYIHQSPWISILRNSKLSSTQILMQNIVSWLEGSKLWRNIEYLSIQIFFLVKELLKVWSASSTTLHRWERDLRQRVQLFKSVAVEVLVEDRVFDLYSVKRGWTNTSRDSFIKIHPRTALLFRPVRSIHGCIFRCWATLGDENTLYFPTHTDVTRCLEKRKDLQ